MQRPPLIRRDLPAAGAVFYGVQQARNPLCMKMGNAALPVHALLLIAVWPGGVEAGLCLTGGPWKTDDDMIDSPSTAVVNNVLELVLQQQVSSAPSSADFAWETSTAHTEWKAEETALILIDLWNCHWCTAMSHRTTDLAFRYICMRVRPAGSTGGLFFPDRTV